MTTQFNDLGLSRPGIEHATFRMRDERHHRGLDVYQYLKARKGRKIKEKNFWR